MGHVCHSLDLQSEAIKRRQGATHPEIAFDQILNLSNIGRPTYILGKFIDVYIVYQ